LGVSNPRQQWSSQRQPLASPPLRSPLASPPNLSDDVRPMVNLFQRAQRLPLAAVVCVSLPLVGALLVSFLVTPDDIESGRVVLSPPCTMRALFGRPCPSCGLTRGFAALSHGDIARATGYNPATVPLYILFWLGAILGVILILRRLTSGPAALKR
jgi:uncharacterized protein DUF2752